MVDGGAEEVWRGAVELLVLLAALSASQVLVRRHGDVDVRVERPEKVWCQLKL